MPHDIAVIRELVTAALSDDELTKLCFDHFHAIYEQFAAGQTRGQRVLALVEYADRQLFLDDLLARVKVANPGKYAEFAPRLGAAAGGTAAAPGKPRISLARLPATGPDLFGRERELAALDRAWADPQTHVFSLVAWGGVGKTALVNAWLLALERDGWRGAERVFGWSFYSQGAAEGRQASADPFIDAALRWFGDPDPTAGSPWDKGERLAELVQQRRTLLILDGLEPLQNPPPVEAGRIKDPGLRCLLRSLAHGQPGLCVVTTRLPLDDLREFTGATHVQVDLEQLTPEAGAEYLRKLGVRGNTGELRETAAEYGGHALALTLLGGLLTDMCGGDVRRCHEIGPLEGDSQAGGHAGRVMAAYERWFGPGPERAILQMMGLFDRPADGPALTALRAAPPISGLTDALFRPARSETGLSGKVLVNGPEPQPLGDMDFQRAVAALRRARLLAPRDEARPDELDCHPLVREHFAARVGAEQPAAWQAAHGRLYEHYKTHAKERPDTLAEMAPLYSAVAHGCQAGRRQDALVEVYWRRIQRGKEFFSFTKLGAFGADLAVLAGFFDPPWRHLAAGLTEDAQAFVLNEAGSALRALGRLAEAVEPMRAGLEADIAHERWKEAATIAGNLSELALPLGDVTGAVAYARQGVELADRSGDAFWGIANRTALADALHQAGAVAEAAALFREAEVMQAERQPEFPLLYSLPGYRYCDLLLGQGQPAEVVRRLAKLLEWRQPGDSLLDIALENLAAGRAHLMLAGEPTPPAPLPAREGGGATPPSLPSQGREGGRGDERGLAASHLDRAVEGLRQAGQQQYIPLGLMARAALRRVAGDVARARPDLDEALAIAQRGGMKLYEADCHLEAARLHLALDAIEPARASLAKARAMIREMGYGRREGEVAALEKILGAAAE
ncbi:MAG: hypothetical protein NT169_05420 [Chloroflexi bacterium]|nr:hypothetical protein [Chloroflexota bacterium]